MTLYKLINNDGKKAGCEDMNETKKNKRGLEDISHFFLSGEKPTKPAAERQEGTAPAEKKANLSEGENSTREKAAHKDKNEIAVARPAHGEVRTDTNMVTAAENFLSNAHPGRFVPVENIRSGRFGTSEFTLFNKRDGLVLCGHVQSEQNFSHMLVSALGYYGWLKECLSTGSLFFGKSLRLLLYLFCDHFPTTAGRVVEQLHGTMDIHLVQYHLLQIPDKQTPIVYFQPLGSRHGEAVQQASGVSEAHASQEEWRAFNALKEHAFKEE